MSRITPGVHTKQQRVRSGRSKEITDPKRYLGHKLTREERAGDEDRKERKQRRRLYDELLPLMPPCDVMKIVSVLPDPGESTETRALRTVRHQQFWPMFNQAAALSPMLRKTLLVWVEKDFRHTMSFGIIWRIIFGAIWRNRGFGKIV